MVEQQIKAQLQKIESDHDVTVLLAIESGSRAWGFPSPDSDYDVRFIYAHRKDWYLQVFELPDVIELEISDELDICGWDLKKALALGAGGNAVLFEWLNGPIIYQAHQPTVNLLRQGINQGFNAKTAFYHYFSQARKFEQYLKGPDEIVKLKRLFYLLRASLCAQWIMTNKTISPVQFKQLLQGLVSEENPGLMTMIEQKIFDKAKMNESDGQVLEPELVNYIRALIGQLSDFDFATQLYKGKLEKPDWNELFVQIINGTC